MTDEPFAIVKDYPQLRRAIAARRKVLMLSQLQLDEIAGFPSGYTGKLEAGVRRFGDMSLETMLSALGLRLMLSHAKHAVLTLGEQGAGAVPSLAHFVRNGQRGGIMRARVLPGSRRTKIAKRAARIRWRKWREQKAREARKEG